MTELIKYLKKEKIGKYLEDFSYKNFNTYAINVKVKLIVFPKNIDNLIKLIRFIKLNNIKYIVLGNSSNVIFDTEYYDGVIIKLDYLNSLKIENNNIIVGAGFSLIKLSMKVAKMGLTGLEFASGIPGTIGGAIYMNAGAYKSDMGYITHKVKVLDSSGKIRTLYNKDLNFHYRTSLLKENKDLICLEATLKLKHGKAENIMEVINSRREKRKSSQPLEFPSAGSVFRNPTNAFAGELIEDCGLKGKNINGAEISMKHANFIINKGGAKGSDVVKLINIVKEAVLKKYNIKLVVEQEIIRWYLCLNKKKLELMFERKKLI